MKTLCLGVFIAAAAALLTAAPRRPARPKAPVLERDKRWENLSREARTVEERLRSDPMMFPYDAGGIVPVPERVEYGDAHLPIGRVGLVLGKGVAADDPRVRLLAERIVRYGGRAEVIQAANAARWPLVLSLGETGLAEIQAPAHPEGYAFRMVRPGLVAVAWRDNLGFTWAVTSLAQLVGPKGFRPAAVEDWPAVARRIGGIPRRLDSRKWFSDYTSPELLNMALYAKNNEIILSYTALIPNHGPNTYWREPRPERFLAQLKRIGEALNPLGITWYCGIIAFGKRDSPQQQEWMLDSGSDRDFEILMKLCTAIAEAGGNPMFYWEDHRKPIGKADRERFGSAREADIFLVNRLYHALRVKYPKLRFIFCPPFYHGPEGAPSPFLDEDREEYLRGIGARFPKDVDICWTGPRVCSTHVTREHLQWITGLLGRKPLYFQNRADYGRRPVVYYPGDHLKGFQTFYFPGFLKEIDGYYFNYSNPVLNALVSQFLWNPDAYDPARTSDAVLAQYLGVELQPALKRLHDALNAFNRTEFRVTPGAVRDLPRLTRARDEGIAAYREMLAARPAAAPLALDYTLPFLNHAIAFVHQLEQRIGLEAFDAAAEAIRKTAVREAGLSAATDRLVTSFDLDGAPPRKYRQRRSGGKNYTEERWCVVVNGSRTNFGRITFDFPAHPWPAEGDYELIVCALDDDAPVPCPIRITVNNFVAHEGPAPFQRDGWTLHTFRIPGKEIFRGNHVLLENLAPSDAIAGPPFLCVAYCIVRKL